MFSLSNVALLLFLTSVTIVGADGTVAFVCHCYVGNLALAGHHSTKSVCHLDDEGWNGLFYNLGSSLSVSLNE